MEKLLETPLVLVLYPSGLLQKRMAPCSVSCPHSAGGVNATWSYLGPHDQR